MKQKKLKNGKTVQYGFRDPEMHKALRSHRHTVIADKKKQTSKTICRSHRRDSAGFFLRRCRLPVSFTHHALW